MCSIQFSMPNRVIKEFNMPLSSSITVKDVKRKLAEACGIPWEELLIISYGTVLKNDAPFSQNSQCRQNRIFYFDKLNQQIRNLQQDVKCQKEKYEEENKRRIALETSVKSFMVLEKKVGDLECKILNLQNQLKEALKLNEDYENELLKYKKQNTVPFSNLERKFLRAIEKFFWPDESKRIQQNRDVFIQNQTQQQDLQKLTQELKFLKQQYDDSQTKLINYEKKQVETQTKKQGRYFDFDNEQTVTSSFFSQFPKKEIFKNQEQSNLTKLNNTEDIYDQQRKSKINTNIEEQLQNQLVSIVGEAAERATKTNNQDIQFSNIQTSQKFKENGSQVICQPVSDKYKFDNLPGVQVLPKTYAVRRISISKQVFENKIESLYYLDPKKDFIVTDECRWDCIRTEKPFQQNKKKNLYLMRKQSDPNELYVLKERLDCEKASLIDAILQCRPQLITKYFMEKFISELKDVKKQKFSWLEIPVVHYADIIILQDYHERDNYWIAERYFGGDSVKYNNNYGYILDDCQKLNHLAQAFTYYTYFTSNFTCMINNIQRVGDYFTDPVLNTNEGDFDENDMGKDGHAMFIVNYEGKRHLGKQYLDLLGIE